jgi:hypothetical protein
LRWDPGKHPRDLRGRWARKLSNRIGTGRGELLGPQGDFTSKPLWRSFPMQASASAGYDIHDARTQVWASMYEAFGGLGRWYGPEHMARFYAENDGAVLVAVRFRPQDLKRAIEPEDSSGLVAPGGADVLVVGVQISDRGQWRTLRVPGGLVAKTSGADLPFDSEPEDYPLGLP